MSLQQTTDYLSTLVKNHAKLQAQHSAILEADVKLNAQLETTEHNLVSHNSQLDHCLDRLHQLVQSRSDQLERAKQLSSALDATVSMNNSKYSSNLDQLQQTTVSISSKYFSLATLAAQLITSLEDLRIRYDDLVISAHAIQPEVARKETQMKALKKEIREILSDAELVVHDSDQCRNDTLALNHKLSEYKADRESLDAKLISLKAAYGHLEQSIQHEQSFSSQVKSRCDTLRVQYDQLVAQHGLQGYCAKHSLPIDAGIVELLRAQSAVKSGIEEKQQQLEQTLQEREREYTRLVEEVNTKDTKYLDMVKENQQLILQIHTLSAQLTSTMGSITKLQESHHNLSLTITGLEHEVHTARKELLSCQHKREELEAILRQKKAQHTSLVEQCETIKEQQVKIESLNTTIQEVEESIEQKKSEVAQIQARLAAIQKENRDKEKAMQKEVKSLETKKQKQVKALERVTSQKQSLEEEINSLLETTPAAKTVPVDDHITDKEACLSAIEVLKHEHHEAITQLSTQHKAYTASLKKYTNRYKAFLRLKNTSVRIERLKAILNDMQEFKQSLTPSG